MMFKGPYLFDIVTDKLSSDNYYSRIFDANFVIEKTSTM